MRHRDLLKIIKPIQLPDGMAMAAAAADKLNRRPVSTSSRGLIKCSGKDRAAKVAFIRRVNFARMTVA